VQIYDYVEAMQYEHAHAMAAVLIGFSFIVLLVLHVTRPRASTAQ
jgi:molybdate transport system permease protein